MCIKKQVIDLSQHEAYVNGRIPLIINCGVWYKGTGPNYKDHYYLKLELRDKGGNVIESFDSGMMQCSEEWQQLTYQFVLNKKKLKKKVRYLVWEDGGKDAEKWAGHYGSRISESYVSIEKYDSNCIATYCFERPAPLYNQKYFISNFNTGVGKKYFIKGVEKRSGHWNNLRDQSLLPTFNGKKQLFRGVANIVSSIIYEDAYNGGSSLRFYGRNLQLNGFAIFKLFKIQLLVQSGCKITIATKHLTDESVCHVVLFSADQRVIHLVDSIPSYLSLGSGSNIYFVQADINQGCWVLKTFNIPKELIDIEIQEIGLCCYTTGNVLDLLLGQIRLLNGPDLSYDLSLPAQVVSNGRYTLTWLPESLDDSNCDPVCHINLEWTKNEAFNEPIYFYLYQEKLFLDKVFSTRYLVDNVKNLKDQPIKFTIVPILEQTDQILEDKKMDIVVTYN
jgi:hypothetical protein